MKVSHQARPPMLEKISEVEGDFDCLCEQSIPTNLISIHINDWSEMQDTYGDLYNSLSILVEDHPFKETLSNSQAVLDCFKLKLEEKKVEVSYRESG